MAESVTALNALGWSPSARKKKEKEKKISECGSLNGASLPASQTGLKAPRKKW